MTCRAHVSQLRDKRKQLDELGIVVRIISFDVDVMARLYVESMNVDWPLLIDESKQLYRDYGMDEASWWTLINPWSIAKYVWTILQGNSVGKPGANVKQLGGDVLVDPQGIVRLHHISNTPHDRPDLQEILALVRAG